MWQTLKKSKCDYSKIQTGLNSKPKMWQKAKTQKVTKPQKVTNTQKLKMRQNSKCDKTQNVTRLKKLKYHKTQQLKIFSLTNFFTKQFVHQKKLSSKTYLPSYLLIYKKSKCDKIKNSKCDKTLKLKM